MQDAGTLLADSATFQFFPGSFRSERFDEFAYACIDLSFGCRETAFGSTCGAIRTLSTGITDYRLPAR